MKKTLLILLSFILGLTASVALLAGGEEHEEHEEYEDRMEEGAGHDDDDDHVGWLRRFFGDAEAATFRAWRQDPAFVAYNSECGDCHMAYPPEMLPQQSWQALMTSLDDHFGDNAEFDATRAARIGAFLQRYSIDAGAEADHRRGPRMQVSYPARITQSRWFRAQHHEIPVRMVTNNPDIGSFSRCDACHTRGMQGSFNEHEVRIPGYGRWDD